MSEESTTARPARFAAGSGANGGASGVTLTAQELAAALRLGDSPEELAQATRLLAYATEAVEKHAPEAPETVQNEAAIRIAGYLYDAPMSSRGAGYAAVLRNSGAAGILLPYRVHRAGSTAGAGAGTPAPGAAPGAGR